MPIKVPPIKVSPSGRVVSRTLENGIRTARGYAANAYKKGVPTGQSSLMRKAAKAICSASGIVCDWLAKMKK